MSSLKLHLLANFVGRGWSALMGLAFVPLYIKFMGIEAYGLIGFYVVLQGALQILDFGLTPTMNREMARYSVQPEKADEARNLVRTLEVGYWVIGVAVGAVVLAAAPFIATHWINASAIPTGVVQQAVVSMGVLVVLQWPLSFYQGGLLGLQRQVLLNGLQIIMTTLRSGGAVLILWLVSPTITAFFSWQTVISAVHVALITLFLWRSLPPSGRAPRFDPSLIRNIWRFAAGMSGITVSALILTQLDKVILSKLLSLENFGYYMLAFSIANGLAVIVGSVFNAIFPRFSALVAMGAEGALKQLYHRSSQMMAVLLVPVTAVLVLFSYDILLLWTGNAEIAHNVAPIVSVLVIGTALNGLMYVPYALQLAHGWTKLGLFITIALIITLVPAIFFMTTHYGAVGAATVWVMLNSIYMLIGVPLTHRRLLKGEARRWFGEDIGLPLVGSVAIAVLSRALFVSPTSPITAMVTISTVLLGAMVVAVLAASQIRSWIAAQVVRAKALCSIN